MSEPFLNSTRKIGQVPRGKRIARHNKTAFKTTVSLYLSKSLVEKAKKNKLNLSRILEEALSSILAYIEAPNIETSKTESSKSFGEAFLQRKGSGARSSAWLERQAHNLLVAGSNPAGPTSTLLKSFPESDQVPQKGWIRLSKYDKNSA